MNKKTLLAVLGTIGLVLSLNANAGGFGKYGYIKRILTDQQSYSGCMIYLDTPLNNSCPSNWVSLDCHGKFFTKDKDRGAQMLSTAIAAAHAKKQVYIYAYNHLKVNSYCVVGRLDVVY